MSEMDMARQRLTAWIKRQSDALPENRAEWAHGRLDLLRDLHTELDVIFGPLDAGLCDICGRYPATISDGMVGANLCEEPECFAFAWDASHGPFSPDPAPCGHMFMRQGCGGCDPSAIDYEFGGEGTA